MAVSKEFWIELFELQKWQRVKYSEFLNQPDLFGRSSSNCVSSSDVIRRCEQVVENVIENLVTGDCPFLRIPKPMQRSGEQKNAGGECLVGLGSRAKWRHFTVLMNVLGKAYRNMKDNTYATKRDVYYGDVQLFRNQQSVNVAVEELARMMEVPRRCLHLTATAKGLIAGNLAYKSPSGTLVDVGLSECGLVIPDYVADLRDFRSSAKYILVIEKDATFQQLLDCHFHRMFGPCILVTGKGYPDVATREMVSALWVTLKIPVLALTDADPYGLHIAVVYKFGAMARMEENLKTAGLCLLGILPSELREMAFPPNALEPLTPKDHGKLASLAAHPIILENPRWLQQINCLGELGLKGEIQSLTHISPKFLTEVYLPTKLRQGGWIV